MSSRSRPTFQVWSRTFLSPTTSKYGAVDLLFRIDPGRFTLALRQAEAVLAGKKAAAERAASDRARYEKLGDAAVSQQQREAVLATDLQAKAAYEQAAADVDVARLNLARSEVCASVSPLHQPHLGRTALPNGW
jgi:multidrug resistance efflux pump